MNSAMAGMYWRYLGCVPRGCMNSAMAGMTAFLEVV